MPRTPRRAAMTLIELLVALVAAALVITLVVAVFHTVSVAFQGQKRMTEKQQTADALRQLIDDLSTLAASPKDEACTLSLAPVTGDEPLLEMCIAKPSGNELDLRWFESRHVVYSLHAVNGVSALTRVEAILLGPKAREVAVTNTLVTPVAQVVIEAFDGNEWGATWPTQSQASWPQAMRVALASTEDDGGSQRAEVLVPLGLSFASTVKTQSRN